MNANSSNEISPEDKNYKINMNILSSLKPLQGKVVNLNSEDILPKKEDDNQSNFITIDNFSTANSIPKITKEILFNNISPNYIPLKNISKTTSVFNPIPQYLNSLSRTINYYNFNFNNPLNSQNLFLNKSKSNFHRFLNKKKITPIQIINNGESIDDNNIYQKKDNILLIKKQKKEKKIIKL